MTVKMVDLGVAAAVDAAYGGAVTAAEWWDRKRMASTTNPLLKSEVFNQAGFYTYLVIGLAATLNAAFGWVGKSENSTGSKVSVALAHGFFYDIPRFTYNTVNNLKTTAAHGTRGEPAAVMQAREILAQRRAMATHSGAPTNLVTRPEPQGGATPEVLSRRGY